MDAVAEGEYVKGTIYPHLRVVKGVASSHGHQT